MPHVGSRRDASGFMDALSAPAAGRWSDLLARTPETALHAWDRCVGLLASLWERWRPADTADQIHRIEVGLALVDRGVSATAPSVGGLTPLAALLTHAPAFESHPSAVEAWKGALRRLVHAGARWKEQPKEGESYEHWCARAPLVLLLTAHAGEALAEALVKTGDLEIAFPRQPVGGCGWPVDVTYDCLRWQWEFAGPLWASAFAAGYRPSASLVAGDRRHWLHEAHALEAQPLGLRAYLATGSAPVTIRDGKGRTPLEAWLDSPLFAQEAVVALLEHDPDAAEAADRMGCPLYGRLLERMQETEGAGLPLAPELNNVRTLLRTRRKARLLDEALLPSAQGQGRSRL